MYNTLKEVIKVKNLKAIITNTVNSCQSCQREKDYTTKYGILNGEIYATRAFQTVSTDIMGPIPLNEFKGEGNIFVLAISDCFTRFIKLFPIKNITAKKITKCMKQYTETHTSIERVISDQGTQFMSKEFKKLLKDKKIIHTICSAYNPTANGLIERANRNIGNSLRTLKGMDFKKAIKITEEGMNQTYHTAINTIPCLAAGISPTIEILSKIEVPSTNETIERLKLRYKKSMERLNNKRIAWNYKENNLVMIKQINPLKMDSRWIGPYRIIKIGSRGNSYCIDTKEKLLWVNIKRIRPYKGEDNVVSQQKS